MRTKIGRNDPCFCGSGKKFKHCHEAKAGKMGRFWLFAVAGLVAAALIIIVVSVSQKRDGAPGRVWSPEHGHWHDVQ